MDKYNILVIDDSTEIVELIEIYLVNEGFMVHKAATGLEGLQIMKDQNIDLVILDIMMPGIDGMETCKRIRKERNIPIIMLSAKSQDMDKILGLGIGADDYMTKPFNPMELIARVKSQLRRYHNFNDHKSDKADPDLIQIKDLMINRKNHSVKINDIDVNLTPTEFDILFLLADHAGTVFGAEEIFEKVWKEKYLESNNTVMVHMWRLREKIEENPKDPKYIETVWGVGYKIEN